MRHKSIKHEDSGVATVELALLIPVLVLLIAGILEFGHAWYIKQAITSASREGARHGIVYRTVTVSGATRRANPLTEITPSIAGVVDTYLSQFLPTGSWTVPTPILKIVPPNTNLTDAGNELQVTVNALKQWSLLQLIGLQDITISATTTMKLE
jgi:Flp pilus assembly protein TadG